MDLCGLLGRSVPKNCHSSDEVGSRDYGRPCQPRGIPPPIVPSILRIGVHRVSAGPRVPVATRGALIQRRPQ